MKFMCASVLERKQILTSGKNRQENPVKQIEFYNRENSKVVQVGSVHLPYFSEKAILFYVSLFGDSQCERLE